jgi:hypothetical protein
MVKWALDLHRSEYVDRDIPFGLHIWETLSLPHRPLLGALALVNHRNEVFATPTDIIMYLYSQAFSGRVRLYATPKALEDQEYFDHVLYPATRTVFLNEVFNSKDLRDKILLNGHHLRKWNSLMQLLWPLMYILYRFWFKVDASNVGKAWRTIFLAIDAVEKDLNDSLFLAGDRLSAADLSFASHMKSILDLKSPDPTFQARIARIENSKVGHYVRKLLDERVVTTGTKLDRDVEENNPDWGDNVAYLRTSLVNSMMLTVIPLGLPFLISMDWSTTLGYWLLLTLSIYFQGVFRIMPILKQKVSFLKTALVTELSSKHYKSLKSQVEILKSARMT